MLGPDAGCSAVSGKAFLSRGEFLLSSGLPPTHGTAFPALGGPIGLAARIHCWESSPSFRSFWLWKQTGIKSSFPKNASKEARGFCLPLLVFRGVSCLLLLQALSLCSDLLSFPRDTSCPPRSQLESLGNQRCFWVQKSSWLWHGQRGLSITPRKCCHLAAPNHIPAEGKGPGLHLLSCSCSRTPA